MEAAEELHDSAILSYRDHKTICARGSVQGWGERGLRVVRKRPVALLDLHFSLWRHDLVAEAEGNRALWINARRKLHIVNLNPEYVPECYYSNLGLIGASDYVVGQFFWELSTISKAHEPGVGASWTRSDRQRAKHTSRVCTNLRQISRL